MKKFLLIAGMLVCLAIIVWSNSGCKKPKPAHVAAAPAIAVPEPMPVREHKPIGGAIPDSESTHPH